MRFIFFVIPGLLVIAGAGCGLKNGDVSIESEAFSTSGNTLFEMAGNGSINFVSPLATLSTFKFCVGKVKLENEEDKAEKRDGEEEIEFRPGLIDVSSGEAKSWGAMNVPTGFKLKKLKIKVKKDKDFCNVDYSINFNGTTTSQDVEFKWKFDPPVEFKANDTLSLALANVVAALRTAADQGTLASMKDHIEGQEGDGSKR